MEDALDVRHKYRAFLAKTTQDIQQIVDKVRTLQEVVVEAESVKLGRTVKHHPYLPWLFG